MMVLVSLLKLQVNLLLPTKVGRMVMDGATMIKTAILILSVRGRVGFIYWKTGDLEISGKFKF